MIQKIRYKIRQLSKGTPVRNNLTVLDNDIFIVSYPRSGNTWLRFLIANLISDENINWKNIDRIVPDIYRSSDKELLKTPQPRLLKSHHSYDPRYKKVIYIVRDPRDVLISYHNFMRKFSDKETDLETFIHQFTNGKLDDFGTYSQNVKSWIRMKDELPQSFLLLKYEDLIKNTDTQLKQVSAFLSLSKSDNQIHKAIKDSSFLNMKKLEQKEQNSADLFINSNKNISFIRKGEIGNWKKHLTIKQHEKIIEIYGSLMKELNYNTNFSI